MSADRWLVNRDRDLLARPRLRDILPLILDSNHNAHSLSNVVHQRVPRANSAHENLNSYDGRTAPPENESFVEPHFSRPNQKVHFRLHSRCFLGFDPSRIVLQNSIDYVALENGNPGERDLLLGVRK